MSGHEHEHAHHHERHGHRHGDDAGPQPTVFTLRTEVGGCAGHGGVEAAAALRAFVEDLLAGLEAAGCRLIGHVKGVLTSAGGNLYVNATSFSGGVALRGAVGEAPGECRLTLNAIVYGVDEDVVARVAREAAGRHLAPPSASGR